MSWDQLFVLSLALAAILLLAFEKAHLSVLGVGLVVVIGASEIISAEATLAGFANPAVITVAALFIVGDGFMRTGAASAVAERILRRTGEGEGAVVFLIMLMAATLSAFINNTLVVVTFLPVITSISRSTGIAPSRLLIPLSYASIVGGMCTLVGTSTNLLVDGILEKYPDTLAETGRESVFDVQPLGMFEFSAAGVLLAMVGILYLGLFGRRLLPRQHSLSSRMTGPAVREYVMEVTVGDGSRLIGQPVTELWTGTEGDVRTVMVVRGESLLWPPFAKFEVRAGDILMLSGPIQALTALQVGEGLAPTEDPDTYDPGTMAFFEIALRPGSSLVGRNFGEIGLKHRFGAVVVAVQRAGKHVRDRLSSMTLSAGDVLLAFGDDRSKNYLRQSADLNLIEGVDEKIFRRDKAPVAFAVIALVILLFITGLVHYSIAALIGALLMTVTNCLTIRQAHNAVNWPVIVFIGGTLALSKALVATGTTQLVGDTLQDTLGSLGPYALLAGMYLGSMLLTETLSNNAVAVIMTPVALATAEAANLTDYRPLVFAVALGASSCFANPIGYQTNLLVMGPGGYRFRDFLKVGLPMDVLMAITGILVIPMIWPLEIR